MGQEWLSLYPQTYAKSIEFGDDDSLANCLDAATKKFRANELAVCMGSTMTYGELDDSASRLAGWLQKKAGISPGDRVAIMLPNVQQFLVSFYAVQKIGGISVHTNPLYTSREMKHQFVDSGAKVLVILDMFMDKLESIIAETSVEKVIVTSIADQFPTMKSLVVKTVLKLKGKVPSHKVDCFGYKQVLADGAAYKYESVDRKIDDTCILQYTGGTTGPSKGAELSSRNLLANTAQIMELCLESKDLKEGKETALTALPLYHIFALTVNFLAFMRLGYRMILVPQPVPIINTVKAFTKYRPSLMTGVNTLFNALNNSREFKELNPNFVKIAIAGGMALQDQVNKEWEQLTGRPILQGFGLTEASPVTHVAPLSVRPPTGSIGLPVIGTDAKVVGENGEELPHGEAGELIVKGPQVMKGYWKRNEESEKAIRDGWLYTGDIAKRDEEGWFYIVDRKKDMIIVSGFNVYPNEVEEVLASHPKVLECAVIGIPDGQGNERVKAFVVKKDENLEEKELTAFCRDNLTGYKRPREFEFREELPKTNVGKILRKDLRQSA